MVKVNGQALLDALENSVCLYPALEGRFPQVSHIEFEFDPRKPRGTRVANVKVAKEPIDLKRVYVVATRGYMAHGKDGFDSLKVVSEGGTAEEVVSEENGVLISTIIRQYFLSLKVMRKWKQFGPSLHRHWDAINERLHQRHPVVEPNPPEHQVVEAFRRAATTATNKRLPARLEGIATPPDESEDEHSETEPVPTVPTVLTDRERELAIMRRVTRKWWRLAGLKGHPGLCDELGEGEFMANWTKASRRSEIRIHVTVADLALGCCTKNRAANKDGGWIIVVRLNRIKRLGL